MRLIGSIHIDHPSALERARGDESRVSLAVDRGLKSGKLDIVRLSEEQLIDLIADGAAALRILRDAR